MTGLFVVVKAVVLYPDHAAQHAAGQAARDRLAAGAGRRIRLRAPGAGDGSGLIWPSLGGKLMVAVTLSMFLIPVFALILDRLTARAAASATTFDTPEEETTSRVIVIGYGRVGQLVGEMLTSHKLPRWR
jgi:CPA2 family monovalent cation:H+ antiporter-2